MNSRILLLLIFGLAGTLHATTRIDDSFTDGNRSNTTGGDVTGGVWYQTQNPTTPNQLTVVDDSAGIGSGNALRLVPSAAGHKVLTFFSPTTLANPGDGIQVTFDYRFPVAAPNLGSGFRVGLLNSNGTRQSADASSTSTRSDDKGYDTHTNPGLTTTSTGFWGEPAGDEILGGAGLISAFNDSVFGACVASGTAKHRLVFRITRQANGDIALYSQIDGRGAAVATHPAGSVITYTFDELAFGFGSMQSTILVDNVVVKALYTPPAVALTSPVPDTTFASSASVHLTSSASATTGNVTKVEFYRGSTKIGEKTSAPYEIDWIATERGVWSLTAVAYDERGGVMASAPVDIRIAGGTPDAFDSLRARRFHLITGGTYNTSDPDIASRVNSVSSSAQSSWDSMIKTGGNGRVHLWSDLASTTSSSHVSGNYGRLRAMALAYVAPGSSLQGNASLLADIVGGLDWLFANRYSDSRTEYGNWFDWEIQIPLYLNDIATLLYDQIAPSTLMNQMRAIDHFMPDTTFNTRYVTSTAANRVWNVNAASGRAIIVKDGAKLATALGTLSEVFIYLNAPLSHLSSTGEGFYDDGSFIDHLGFAYNGGYGNSLLENLSSILALTDDSPWAVTDPNRPNLYQWVYKSFEPFLYRGAMMDNVRGREISRSSTQDHVVGHNVIASILQIAEFAPTADAANFKALAKALIQADTSRNFLTTASIPSVLRAKAALNDDSVAPRPELLGHRQFPSMDRVVHRRPGFAFAVSMCSSRIYNYESINGENLRGWHQGDGATYLYNSDIDAYSSDYWPTVDAYRLAGITVDTQTRAGGANQANLSPKSWAGGAEILELYGSSGFELQATASTLTACKSWFMFDNEVVALGSGITSTDNRRIETIVENRRLNNASSVLMVDGITKPTALGWNETMNNVRWCNLAATGGYVFPGKATIKALRESRTDAWVNINSSHSSTPVSRNFATLWFDHGSNPSGSAYSYILLPNQTAAQTASYAGSPDVVILENTSAAHAVREQRLGITAAHFWEDGTHTAGIVTADKKSAVMVVEAATHVDVSISDPTQLATDLITVELARSATGVASVDPQISIVRLSPTIQFTANVSGTLGRTLKASFIAPDTLAPMGTITEPAGSPVTTTSAALDISGTATDNVGVVQVSWTNSLGGSGMANITGSMWSIPALPLQFGNNVITIIVSDAASNTATATLTVKRQSTFAAWQSQKFSAAELVDSSISGPAADPNHNGIANLIEFALNGNPTGNMTGRSILPQISRSGTNQLQLTFSRYLDRNDITLTVQGADQPSGPWSDLATSTAGGAFVVLVTGASVNETGTGNTRTVTVGDAYLMSDSAHPRRFLRLEAVTP